MTRTALVRQLMQLLYFRRVSNACQPDNFVEVLIETEDESNGTNQKQKDRFSMPILPQISPEHQTRGPRDRSIGFRNEIKGRLCGPHPRGSLCVQHGPSLDRDLPLETG